jgi:CRP-like cAMP-binding protein
MSYVDARWVAKHLSRSEAALFTPDELEELAPMLQPIHLSQGHVLFERGESPAGAWIMQSGWVGLLAGATRTAGLITLMGPRQCVGDIPLMLDEVAPYRAEAFTDSTCLFIEAADLHHALAANPTFLRRWTGKLAGRVARAQGRIVEMLGTNLREQVARVVLHECDGGVFPFAQEVCAAMLGASRAPVNQVLKELERDGAVRLGYGHVEIIDENLLAAAASEETRRQSK